MAEYSGEKNLEPTPHRRQQAREKGQVAYSQDLTSAALLLVGVLILTWNISWEPATRLWRIHKM